MWLGGNALSVLRADTFHGAENLEKLVLSNNNLSHAEDGAFNGLPNLAELYLYGNKFTSLRAKMFSGLDSLNKIIITYNHISTIEVGTFAGMSNLTELWMDHNYEKLRDMQSGTFMGLSSLEILYIHGNRIQAIPTGLFKGLHKLTEIGLDDNEISEIETGAFQGLDSLSKVWLYNNKLTTLESSTFTGLPRNIELTIGKNPLKCDESLCWLRKLEREGFISWIELEDRPREPQCEDGREWKNLTLKCQTGGKKIASPSVNVELCRTFAATYLKYFWEREMLISDQVILRNCIGSYLNTLLHC